MTWVAEVKSITAENEERQLRFALGQVSRYRHQLSRAGREVRAVIAVEREPYDHSWLDLCEEQNITLAWPETMKSRLPAAQLVSPPQAEAAPCRFQDT